MLESIQCRKVEAGHNCHERVVVAHFSQCVRKVDEPFEYLSPLVEVGNRYDLSRHPTAVLHRASMRASIAVVVPYSTCL